MTRRRSTPCTAGIGPLALTRGRDYVVPRDIAELAPDVIRHRLVLSYEALADRVSADEILDRVLERVPQPQRPFVSDAQRYAAPATETQAPV